MLDRILVVDDEPLVLDVLTDVLAREGFHVAPSLDAATALHLLSNDAYELVLSDIRMSGLDGFDLLRQIRRSHPGTDVILMTGHASLDGAIDALALGAADYLIKPLRPKEVVARIRTILQRRRLEAELHALQSQLRSRYEVHNLVAVSPRMTAVASAIRRVAQSKEPIVFSGEPGSGREFVARVMHHSGTRRDRPLIRVACDSAQDAEFERQLFGDRLPVGRSIKGQIERAREGTLLLTEVQELLPAAQRRLAHTLASGSFTRTNDLEKLPLEARVVMTLTATKDSHGLVLEPELAQLLKQCTTISVPTLRQRREDLSGLVHAFLENYASDYGQLIRVTPEAIALISELEFTGNVSELFHVLTMAAKNSLDGTITPPELERSLRQAGAPESVGETPMANQLDDREFQIVLRAVARHPGRLDEAARELRVSRTTLWRRMRKHGIKLPLKNVSG